MHVLRRIFLICLAVTWGLAVAGEAPTALVEIQGMSYNPQQLSVSAGTTVRWENKEKRQYHNVWFKSLDEIEPEIFFPGEFYQRRFDTPGTYHYECGPHPEMKGTIYVK